MAKEITTLSQFRSFLLSKKIDLNDYTYKEENNKYGIKDTEPLKNPYLWSKLISDQYYRAVDYMLYYNKDLFNVNIGIALLQSRNDNGLDTPRLTKILDLIYEDTENKDYNTDGVLMDIIVNGKYKLFKRVVEYMKAHDIHPNPQGSFYRDAISEAAKIDYIGLIQYIINEFPDIVEKADVTWGFLNSLKRANYLLAKYLIFKFQDSIDIHAKNDLGYKLIEKNIKQRGEPLDQANKEAYHFILDLYLIEHKNDS